ncbi:centrosomal protein of 72 kDa-like isoform X1 [Watersipora subatra]|uniref:centrosomal protein of 72 kDa-like isoform X1 n=1 Tax=Watersipora subatra TaxID=2589382 RepID=UPI00355C3F37
MMAALTTAISEEWIRQRVGLDHENLEDVKSLALPGTYHEKITTLGTSLHNFTRLKNLDLSRNSLESVKGLENCTLLENVNLYYNNLTTLEDLSPLRRCTKITNLDLRLNPVARTEADYRLFVVNILPNLKILDDRPVRESERDSAAAHFAPTKIFGQKAFGTDPLFEVKPLSSSKNRIIPSGIMGATTMDADDRAVLDLLSKCDEPTTNTGSSNAQTAVEDYNLQELKAMGTAELESEKGKNQDPMMNPDDLASKTSYYQSKYPNIPAHRLSEITGNDIAKQEVDAYTTYKGQGHFTPNPELAAGDTGCNSSSPREEPANNSTQEISSNAHLNTLLDLVDKYWNGSKSLHDNKKFMKMATELQAKMSSDGTIALQAQIKQLTLENEELLKTAHAHEALKRVKTRVEQAEAELVKLRTKISELQEENTRLRVAQNSQSGQTGTRSFTNSRELDELKHENYQLQFKLKQFSQMSELATMLQESHKSLVETNDHLLREIEEMRAAGYRHVMNGP